MKQKALEKLLAEMSLEEKIGQLVQIPGFVLQDGAVLTGPDMGFDEKEM